MIYIDWFEYNNIVDKLIENNKTSLQQYNYLYGIPRGGTILANILSYKLNIPVLNKINECSVDNILIVDDICDSGKTIKKYMSSYDTLVLFVNNKSNLEPTYFYEYSSEWLVFPYEYDVNSEIEYSDTVSSVNKLNIEERRNAN